MNTDVYCLPASAGGTAEICLTLGDTMALHVAHAMMQENGDPRMSRIAFLLDREERELWAQDDPDGYAEDVAMALSVVRGQ